MFIMNFAGILSYPRHTRFLMMTNMRFYFDYSDYRSYLMMHTLEALDFLPSGIRWVAVDAYSLRALSGSAEKGQTQLEREFLRKEAQRFCERERLEFIWQASPIRCGTALQAGIWLMSHAPERFTAYSKKALELIWGRGNPMDAAMLRSLLDSMDIDADEVLRKFNDGRSFQYQDACLQEALALGVFDVPAILIGDVQIRHFDQKEELRRLALMEYLKSIPQNSLLPVFADHMLSLPKQSLTDLLDIFAGQPHTSPVPKQRLHPGFHSIQHFLSVPAASYPISKRPMPCALKCQTLFPDAPVPDAIISRIPDHTVGLCPFQPLDFSFDDIPDVLPDPHERLLICSVKKDRQTAVLCLHTHPDSAPDRICLLGNAPFLCRHFCGLNLVILSKQASADIHMARLCAYLRADVVIRFAESDATACPISEAFACVAQAWVIECTPQHIRVFDNCARSQAIPVGASFELMPNGRLPMPADVWHSGAPRTLLLVENALSFGAINDNADVEMACRGCDLIISAANQSIGVSRSRDFACLRIGEANLAILPMHEEQIFAVELLAYRLIHTINRAAQNALPVIVNDWAGMAFEMLEILRPIYATIVALYRIPLILVIGSQVIEIWHAGIQGIPYRIEKDEDRFTIDTREMLRSNDAFLKILENLSIPADIWLSRLETIEKLSKEGNEP